STTSRSKPAAGATCSRVARRRSAEPHRSSISRQKGALMAKKVQDVMTANPTTLPESATLLEAARRMRDSDIGDVIVMRDSELCGIATDRDIVVRAIADGKDPSSVALREVCSHDVTSVAPSDTIEHAVELIRSRALRRLPVGDKGRPI